MSNSKNSYPKTKADQHLDALYGAAEIGAFMRKDRFWVYRQIHNGVIPVTRIAGEFVTSKAALREHFAERLKVMEAA